ncbi:MAG: hypothetical protein IPP34_18775 [Bacteroidetes bacterium]|nr:hypothetical protein [Bacteroidota bacterium]
MVNSGFNVSGNEISFILPDNVDSKRTLVIDPFVTNTNNLSGLNNGIAKDVDYDYAGNVYVTGGGMDQFINLQNLMLPVYFNGHSRVHYRSLPGLLEPIMADG